MSCNSYESEEQRELTEIEAALSVIYDFKDFTSWKTLFNLAEKYQKHLYVTQYFNGCPVSRFEVAMVANDEKAECPVVLFSSGGLTGDDAGNVGGSLVLHFFPPIRRCVIDTYDFREPQIR